MKISNATQLLLQRLADDLANAPTPTTLAELGSQLAADVFESPEAMAKYFKKPLAWTTLVKDTLVRSGAISEAAFWRAFSLSVSRQRPCIVLPPAEPGVVNNLNP